MGICIFGVRLANEAVFRAERLKRSNCKRIYNSTTSESEAVKDANKGNQIVLVVVASIDQTEAQALKTLKYAVLLVRLRKVTFINMIVTTFGERLLTRSWVYLWQFRPVPWPIART